MVSYLVNDQKKKRTLAKREKKLSELLQSDTEESKVVLAAEEVREAMIRVIKVKQRPIHPDSENGDELLLKFKQQIRDWETLPVANIIERYRNAT